MIRKRVMIEENYYYIFVILILIFITNKNNNQIIIEVLAISYKARKIEKKAFKNKNKKNCCC